MSAAPLLEIERAEAGYGGRVVIGPISISIERREVVGLVGPNGAGKSTLLRLAAGVIAARSGRVLLHGSPIAGMDRSAIARNIAWLAPSQTTELAFSVREIVALGRLPHLGPFRPPREADRAAIDRAIAAAALGGLAGRAFPDLSEGEKQRVLLARCLAQEPSVLLLDEPTASLDVRHAWALMRVVRARADAGAGVLASIHDLALAARICDRVIVIAGGKIVSDGAPVEALNAGVIAETFGMRVRVDRDGDGIAITVLGASE